MAKRKKYRVEQSKVKHSIWSAAYQDNHFDFPVESVRNEMTKQKTTTNNNLADSIHVIETRTHSI